MTSVLDLPEGNLLRAAHDGSSEWDRRTWFRVPAAPDARALRRWRPSEIERAQGRPGADRARGPPAAKKAGGSYHRFGRGIPAFPARRF